MSSHCNKKFDDSIKIPLCSLYINADSGIFVQCASDITFTRMICCDFQCSMNLEITTCFYFFSQRLQITFNLKFTPVIRSPTSLTFRHWAGVSPHTWSYDFAETCVFGKQSPGPGHCDPLCEEAPLLPKLRGYFAEFLRESCLAPLGILYLPTCVGFGYRYPFVEGRSSFSWEYSMGYFSAVAPGTRTLARGIFSTPSYPEKTGTPCVLEPITIFRLT